MFDIQPKDIVIPVISVFLTGVVVFAIQLFVQRYLSRCDYKKNFKKENVRELNNYLNRVDDACMKYNMMANRGEFGQYEEVSNKLAAAIFDLNVFFERQRPALIDIQAEVEAVLALYSERTELIAAIKEAIDENGLRLRTREYEACHNRLSDQVKRAIRKCNEFILR